MLSFEEKFLLFVSTYLQNVGTGNTLTNMMILRESMTILRFANYKGPQDGNPALPALEFVLFKVGLAGKPSWIPDLTLVPTRETNRGLLGKL
jgi:hypothetical protein